MTDLTVVSVLKSGEFEGRRYSAEWVQRLKAMVARNLRQPHRFVCFSDLDRIDGVEVFPLRYDWPGWWSKIELFRWSNADSRMLYLDLDVLATGPLDEIVSFPAPMALMSPIVMKPKPKLVRRYQSSVMVWTPPEGREIYTRFIMGDPRAFMQQFRGDQDWIGHIKPDCPTFPSQWFCKLRQLHGKKPPPGIKVVLCQHPQANDIAAARHPWVKEAWAC